MAGNISNGGIGKSPVIDRQNQITDTNFVAQASEEMEKLIFKRKDILYQPVPITFKGGKTE